MRRVHGALIVASAGAIVGWTLSISTAFADDYVIRNGETNYFRCGGPDGARYTKDLTTIRTGEKCKELTKKDLEKMRADAKRPPTDAEKTSMQGRAKKMGYTNLCAEFGRVLRRPDPTPKGEYWQDVVVKAAVIPKKDVEDIRERRLRVGMDECSVVAILGKPDKLNRTNNARGRSDQLVYRDKGIYVYTDNGIVTSWQE